MTDDIEEQVARHYGREGLEAAILEALAAAGVDLARLTADDLAPAEEFHIGGREATRELARQMDLAEGMHLLDIGCGIGGAARFLAATHACRVTGIDLTAAYVRAAEALTRRVGLDGRVAFRQASALMLPFAPRTFEGAYAMHVGMNIADKPRLFAEARRVLKPGAVFAVYDVMRTGDGEPTLPMPFATSPATSFVEKPAAYRRALTEAGFEIVKERNRHAFAVAFFREAQARTAASGPPPLGPHLLMGPEAPRMIAGLVRNLDAGLIAPVEMICRAAE